LTILKEKMKIVLYKSTTTKVTTKSIMCNIVVLDSFFILIKEKLTLKSFPGKETFIFCKDINLT